MLPLSPHECRALGVLIEKAQTTPSQYPLTLNGLVTGCNQKSNRLPVLDLTEDQVIAALDGLRAKELIREVMLTGSRVAKYRHLAREAIEIGTSEVVILAELLLRGPQTSGELRSRASRMHPLESIDTVENVLRHLMDRPEPLVERLPPSPGSRAPRFAQRLCPDLHDHQAPPAPTATAAPVSAAIESRMDDLESQVALLRRTVQELAEALGQPTPGNP
jgi:uncharacterized protein YceH (UPF0502 family)